MQKMASITSKDAIFYNERWHLLHIRDKGWMWYGLTLRLIFNKHLLQEHKGHASGLFVAQGNNF